MPRFNNRRSQLLIKIAQDHGFKATPYRKHSITVLIPDNYGEVHTFHVADISQLLSVLGY